MLVVRAGLLLLTVLCSTTAANAEGEAAAAAAVEEVQDKSSTTQVEDKSPSDDENKAKFFLKSYSTATWTFLSSFTSTVPYTCYNTGAAVPDPCMGRRLRRSKKLLMALDTISGASGLPISSSQDDFSRDTEEFGQAKRLFTIWKTSSTTFTVTTFSTNRSVTISASVACIFPGAVLNIC